MTYTACVQYPQLQNNLKQKGRRNYVMVYTQITVAPEWRQKAFQQCSKKMLSYGFDSKGNPANYKHLQAEALRLLEKYKDFETAYGYLKACERRMRSSPTSPKYAEVVWGVSKDSDIEVYAYTPITGTKICPYGEGSHKFLICESVEIAYRIAMVFNLERLEAPFKWLDAKQVDKINKHNSILDKKLKRGTIKDVLGKDIEGLK